MLEYLQNYTEYVQTKLLANIVMEFPIVPS
jgi:hypothetical protein